MKKSAIDFTDISARVRIGIRQVEVHKEISRKFFVVSDDPKKDVDDIYEKNFDEIDYLHWSKW